METSGLVTIVYTVYMHMRYARAARECKVQGIINFRTVKCYLIFRAEDSDMQASFFFAQRNKLQQITYSMLKGRE